MLAPERGYGMRSSFESESFEVPRAAPTDEQVQVTHVDAAMAKISCARLGYFEDRWTELLIRNTRPHPRGPLIHRGYYSRVSAMRQTVVRFLERCPPGGVQIVNLGAGFDTLYFWLRENPKYWRDDLVYFEVDFPEVLSKKVSAIKRKQSLFPLLGVSSSEELMSSELGVCGLPELRTQHCRFVSTDMRIEPELRESVSKAGLRSDLPTLFLSECVLVYMQALHGDSIIKWAASAVSEAPSAMVVYEQVNPHDPFGKVMVENLRQRGCPLLSIHEYPTLEAQRQRYLQRGWEQCLAVDMNEVYSKYLDQKDLDRIHKLEMMDEFEEWNLIQGHYFHLVATRTGSSGPDDQETLPGGEPDGNSWIHDVAPSPYVLPHVVPPV
mmetsp:Transcript_97083/g.153069  ORF Transcript_97083/g.153069 Transcript_97083/m.153069 type:complete len:381 (-) Transcript_97083:54-1196(-)